MRKNKHLIKIILRIIHELRHDLILGSWVKHSDKFQPSKQTNVPIKELTDEECPEKDNEYLINKVFPPTHLVYPI